MVNNKGCYQWLIDHKDIQQEECLIWPFARFVSNYGYVKYKGKGKHAHKEMCKLKYGPAPKGKPLALHTCNKGDGSNGCVNPSHLYWCNQSDNELDKRRIR